MPVPGVYRSAAASIGPVQARYRHVMACSGKMCSAFNPVTYHLNLGGSELVCLTMFTRPGTILPRLFCETLSEVSVCLSLFRKIFKYITNVPEARNNNKYVRRRTRVNLCMAETLIQEVATMPLVIQCSGVI